MSSIYFMVFFCRGSHQDPALAAAANQAALSFNWLCSGAGKAEHEGYGSSAIQILLTSSEVWISCKVMRWDDVRRDSRAPLIPHPSQVNRLFEFVLPWGVTSFFLRQCFYDRDPGIWVHVYVAFMSGKSQAGCGLWKFFQGSGIRVPRLGIAKGSRSWEHSQPV